MSKIARNIIIAAVISGFSIIGPNCLSLSNKTVYASEDKPSLRSIYLSEGDNIRFKEDVYSYIVDVDKDAEEAFIKVKPDDPSYIVKINGQAVTKDDNYKKMLNLNKGKNIVEIEVEDSKTESTTQYTVYVYRGGKEAVYLNDIDINGSTIGFGYSSNLYNVELDEGTDLVELETVPQEGNFSITVNGKELGDTNSIKLRFNGIGKYTLNIGLKDKDTGRVGSYTLDIYLGIPVTPNVSDAINSVLKPNQWVMVNGRWRYNDVLGKPLKNAWFYDDKYNSYFHFNGLGNMQAGWIYDGGNWYYLNQNGEMQTGWMYYENKWYFLDSNGVMRTDWIEEDGEWYFLRKNGAMATGWVLNNDRWYFLNSSGVMETGWLYYGRKWYFINPDGVMKTGWVQSEDDWYYLNDDGSMKHGEWLYYNGNWYYLMSDGNMRYDNINDIKRGWLSDKDDNIYFFNEDGTMRTSPITIDGYTYNFNEDGSVNFN
jgi:glucan-binding YG repeat protein